MKNNIFFRPTAQYKEFIILDLIEHKKNITQRNLGKIVHSSVAMINNYLNEYEKKGYIIRKHYNKKNVDYIITKKGIERRKILNLLYFKSSRLLYLNAKNNISVFLNLLSEKGFKKILLYGAGEIAKLIVDVIQDFKSIPIKILGIIDDNPEKIHNYIRNIKIIAKEDINTIKHDGILISSYNNHKKIFNKLINMKYPPNKLIKFFN